MTTWDTMASTINRLMALDLPAFMALLTALIAAMWAGLWWWSVRRTRLAEAPDSAPITLWDCLCRVHDLSEADAARLAAVGQAAAVADHCLMFVDPQWLEQAVAKGSEDAAELARLGRQLFGEVFQEAQG